MSPLLAPANELLAALQAARTSNPPCPAYNAYSYCYGQNNADGSVTLCNTAADHGTFPVPGGFAVPSLQQNGQGPYVGISPQGMPICVTDCSGFASYVVFRGAPDAYAELCRYSPPDPKKHPQPWPSAANFAGLYQHTLTQWSVIASDQSSPADLANAQAGDVFAYGVSSGPDTGHVMLLTGSIAAANGIYTIPVMDESCIPHADDRGRAPSPYFGLGTGNVALQSGTGWQACLDVQAASPFWFSPETFCVLRVQ